MNKTFKIYTSGKMGGLPYLEQMFWRKELEDKIRKKTDKKVIFIHPPNYFDYNYPNQQIAKEWEINQIIESDIVVVDLSTIKNSIGTHMEIGVAEGVNRTGNKHIYIVGIGTPNVEHPWISSSLFYNAKDIDDAADFINTYLLI